MTLTPSLLRAASALSLIAVFAFLACTDCTDRLLQRAAGSQLTAEVHERVCGSAAGFTVRLFPPGTPEASGDAYEWEPFQAKCPPSALRQFAVTAVWLNPTHLEIRHSPGLEVVRAEAAWKGATITYVVLAATTHS